MNLQVFLTVNKGCWPLSLQVSCALFTYLSSADAESALEAERGAMCRLDTVLIKRTRFRADADDDGDIKKAGSTRNDEGFGA